MSIVVDIPFTEFRGRNWHEMERDELQKVFTEACDEQLKPHGLRVRATIVHNRTQGRTSSGDVLFLPQRTRDGRQD